MPIHFDRASSTSRQEPRWSTGPAYSLRRCPSTKTVPPFLRTVAGANRKRRHRRVAGVYIHVAVSGASNAGRDISTSMGIAGRIAPSDEPPISNGAVARRFRTPPLEGSKQKKRRPKQAASLIACGSSKSGELRQTLMPTTAHAEADRTEAEHHQRPGRRFRDSIDREIIGFEGVAGRAQAKRR